MKKIISIFVAMMMLVSMFTVSAFATFSIGGNDAASLPSSGEQTNNSSDVTITVNGDVQHRYAVDIDFGTMAFTFSTGLTWDPTNHVYKDSGAGSWGDAQTITITNHSDVGITYSKSVTDEVTTYGELTVTVTDNSAGAVAACPVGGPAPTGTLSVSVSGTPNQSNITGETLATITITVSSAA